MKHRITVSPANFWAAMDLRDSENLSINERLRRYAESILASMPFESEGWALNYDMVKRLRGVEGSLLRQIVRPRK